MTETSPLCRVSWPPKEYDGQGRDHVALAHAAGSSRASSCGSPTTTTRWCRGTASRSARSRCAARGSPAATTSTTTRRSSTTAGCAPATSRSVFPNGFVQISDRAKDVIKSGGEWVSSVDLENTLMGHPAVLEAAVIGVPDAKWDERPMACVVVREGADRRRRGAEDVARRADGEVVGARAVVVHQRGAEDERRQVRQEGPPRPPHRRRARGHDDRLTDRVGDRPGSLGADRSHVELLGADRVADAETDAPRTHGWHDDSRRCRGDRRGDRRTRDRSRADPASTRRCGSSCVDKEGSIAGHQSGRNSGVHPRRRVLQAGVGEGEALLRGS